MIARVNRGHDTSASSYCILRSLISEKTEMKILFLPSVSMQPLTWTAVQIRHTAPG